MPDCLTKVSQVPSSLLITKSGALSVSFQSSEMSLSVLDARRRYQENPIERSAVAPVTQEQAEVAAVGDAVVVDVAAGSAPGGQQESQVAAIDGAVVVEIAEAVRGADVGDGVAAIVGPVADDLTRSGVPANRGVGQ